MPRRPCEEAEPVADRVEFVMRLSGIEPGGRECHDAQPDRFDVDFVYPEAKPHPLALEITSVRDRPYMAGVPAALRVQDRLADMAEQENLGSWLVTVVPLRSMKELEPEIEALIREGREVHPGQYRVADLLSLGSDQERQEFVAWHQRLKDLGLVGIQRLETRVENGVWFAPMSGVRMIGGFSEALQATVDDNARKFAPIQGYARHLAVLIGRFDFSSDPVETAVPRLPREIDRVWVVPSFEQVDAPKGVWSADRGYSAWTLHRT